MATLHGFRAALHGFVDPGIHICPLCGRRNHEVWRRSPEPSVRDRPSGRPARGVIACETHGTAEVSSRRVPGPQLPERDCTVQSRALRRESCHRTARCGARRGDLSLIPAAESLCLCAPPSPVANVVAEQGDRVENVPARGRPTWHQRFTSSLTVDRFRRPAAASGGRRLQRGLCSRPRPLATASRCGE